MTIPDHIRTIAARLFGYRTQGLNFTKVHYSLTFKNAAKWGHCYHHATITRFGRLVATTHNTAVKP